VRLAPGRFDAERRRFALAFTCEGCAHFDPDAERCASGYPTEDHRLARYDRDPEAEVVFCKDFDLR
jgi:hypothetical protein